MSTWWRTKRSEQNGIHPSAAVSHADDIDAATLQSRIWKLTALPRDEFDLTYGALFNNAWHYAAHLPVDDALPDLKALKSDILSEITVVLRARQSRILPKRLPTEDAARLAELVSFALAVVVLTDRFAQSVGGLQLKHGATSWCALLEPIPKHSENVHRHTPHAAFGSLLIGVLVSPEGLRWLAQEPIILDEVLRYFANDPGSEFRLLVDGESQAPSADTDQAVQQVPTPGNDKSGDDKVANGWRYVSWVREQLAANTLSANGPESFIHALPDNAAYLVVPEAFEGFAEASGVPANRVKNQVVRLGLHRIKADGKNLYRGTLDGRKVQGMVFKDTSAFWAKPPSPSDAVKVRR